MRSRSRAVGRGKRLVVAASMLLVAACGGAAVAPSSSLTPAGGGTGSGAPPAPSGTAPVPSASSFPDLAPSASPSSGSGASDYRGQGASRTFQYSVAKCDGPTGGSWNVDIRESSGGGAFTFYEIPEGSDHAAAQVDHEILLGDPDKLNGTGTFVAGDPPHFVIKNGEGVTDIELEVGSFCR